jgi:5-methylcytosine-specific restriction endonuclease McrA
MSLRAYYRTAGVPKPEPRQRIKARQKRASAKVIKSVRAQVIERAEGRCERCGAFLGLDWGSDGQAHHRIPRSRGGQWTVENIEYLCAACHREAHRTNTL